MLWSGLNAPQRNPLLPPLCGLAFIQNQHPHWYLSLLYDTRLPGALFPLEVLSSSVFTAAGESSVYYLALASNNGTDSMSYILLFPSLWETAEFQAVNCGWYMKSFFGTQGLGVAQWLGRWCAFVRVTGFSFFNHPTSFIFSQCEITTAWQNILSQRRRKEWEEQRYSFTRLSRERYINWGLMFFKVASTSR